MSLFSQIREDYALGRIDHDELERRAELALQHENRNAPIPDSWAKLPPCDHGDWIDITRLGDPERVELCGRCGDQRISIFE